MAGVAPVVVVPPALPQAGRPRPWPSSSPMPGPSAQSGSRPACPRAASSNRRHGPARSRGLPRIPSVEAPQSRAESFVPRHGSQSHGIFPLRQTWCTPIRRASHSHRMPVMSPRLSLLVPALVLLPLAACSGGNPEPAPATVTVTETVFSDPSEAATPAEEEAPTFEPNVGDAALKVGQSRVGQEFTMTMLEVRDPYPPPDEFRLSKPSNRFVGLRLSECVVENPTTPPDQLLSAYNGEFIAVTPQGNEYPGNGSSYPDFPLPKFPELATISTGSCVKGWIAIELPADVNYDKFVYRPGGQTVAEWLVN